MVNAGLEILSLLVVYVLAAVGALAVEMVKGINFTRDHIIFPGKKIPGYFGEKHCKQFIFPPLVIMIILGCIARNYIPQDLMKNYPETWAANIRQFCTVIILFIGAIDMKPENFRTPVFILGSISPILEAIGIALLSVQLFQMNYLLAFSLGLIISGISPAIVIPMLMQLKEKNYGIDKDIPTTVSTSSTLSILVNVIGFAILSNIADTQAIGSSQSVGIITIIIIAKQIGGFIVGLILGFAMQLVPVTSHPYIKAFVNIIVSLASVLLNQYLSLANANYVFIIVYGFMCNRYWESTKPSRELKFIWSWLIPILFGTIGASIIFSELQSTMIVESLYMIAFGLAIRLIATFLTMLIPKKYEMKEILFIAISWIPKATLQAAVGGSILSFAQSNRSKVGDEFYQQALRIFIFSIMSIVITAPIGAFLIEISGKKLLNKQKVVENKVPV